MKKIVFLSILFSIVSIFPQKTHAQKVLPQAKGLKTFPSRYSSTSITVSPRLRKDRQALLVTFGNIQNATTISYFLTYKTSGQEEGAGGSVTAGKASDSRELLFGTCSKNVCRYHQNITDMRFEVNAELKSGKKLFKRYRIKV